MLTFLLQLGFHVNSFPADCRPQIVDFQSMVDSHMLAARLTGLGGELQSCEKKQNPWLKTVSSRVAKFASWASLVLPFVTGWWCNFTILKNMSSSMGRIIPYMEN